MSSKEELAVQALTEASALNDSGLAKLHQGQFTGAASDLQAGLDLLRDVVSSPPVRNLQSVLWGNLANAYFQQGEIDRAVEVTQQQLNMAEKVGDIKTFSNGLNTLGMCYAAKGDDSKAETAFEQRLEIARKIGDKKGEGNTLNNLSTLYLNRKQYGPAMALVQQRLTLARSEGDQRREATGLINLGLIHKATNGRQEARTAWTKAVFRQNVVHPQNE